MATYTDNDGVVWDVIGYGCIGHHKDRFYVDNSNIVSRCGSDLSRNFLIVKPITRYIKTIEEAKAWVEANPDVIIGSLDGACNLLLAQDWKNFNSSTVKNTTIQVALGKFIPLTEIEVV